MNRHARLIVTWLARSMLVCLVVIASRHVTACELAHEQQQFILASAQDSYQRGIELLRSNPDQARTSFKEAARRFEQLVESGIDNGYLHFNLANAHLQAGELGHAILNYRRAEQLIGGDDRLLANLAYARSLREDRIERSGRMALTDALLSWHRDLPLRTRFLVFAGSYAVCFAMLILRLYTSLPSVRWLITCSAIIAILSGTSVAADSVFDTKTTPGVILADEVIVRKGNGEGFEPQFDQPLHEGVEFELIEERGEWVQLQLVNGTMGWVPHSSVGLIAR